MVLRQRLSRSLLACAVLGLMALPALAADATIALKDGTSLPVEGIEISTPRYRSYGGITLRRGSVETTVRWENMRQFEVVQALPDHHVVRIATLGGSTIEGDVEGEISQIKLLGKDKEGNEHSVLLSDVKSVAITRPAGRK